ncbi:SusC/RagA family TonB-linked outer membrane protein [Larkinella arboricola]|uniref:TonB-linked SusC/RagA family outer membrane protein n=1 Tax=Larkinella arboricola TaxID=643671 RepID=A0A327X0R2_LARAB|nr:SusC/RagA family TonB-linked outer membrane protein [Larkinella arboricola]RAJ97874.1 TonB-linked SusC/RagA family outer membrane protein [Larkinella arboricola]
MLKRLLMASLCLLGTVGITYAQNRTITGKVTSGEDSSPLPGVNIVVKGTSRGATSDVNGTYSLSVPDNAQTLSFSFIGFKTTDVSVGNRTTVDVVLQPDASTLQEIVVTALGISREKKALNYSVQELKQEKLNIARDQNVANALAGKIAGVQVLGQSGAKFGSPSIRIRGVNSLTGGDPLYVVDGTPTDVSQVNMDDVENLSVLKGPSATALYGNRASAGVIVITTKRAKAGETRLDINHSTTLDMVGMLPKYQNEYGGGYSQDWATFKFNPAIHPASWASYEGQRMLDYSADESWGPRLDGQPHRSAASWQQGPQFGQLTPYSANPNNVRDFFAKPISNNTNIAFSRGTEAFQSRISYSHIINNGIIPNSSQTRDFVSAKNTIKFAEKLSANLNINYTAFKTTNLPADNYGSSGGRTPSNSPLGISNATLNGYNQTVGSFNQWFQRQLSIDDLRNYKNPDGTFRSWNIGGPTDPRPKYWDSPYTQVYENTNNNRSDRLFGDFGLTYEFTPFLKASATVRRDQNYFSQESRVAQGTLNEGGQGGYATLSANSRENNYEALVSYNQDIADFSLVANVGGNIRYNRISGQFQATVGGLSAPNFYNIAASINRPISNNYLYERQVNSLFGNVSIGYKDFVFVEASIRNDWASTLPKANNSYLYPSVSAGLVFSELIPQNSILSYGKIRASYAQVGTDIGPYQTALAYNSGTAYGSNATLTLPTTLPNAALQPGLSSSYEGGIDLRFLSNRLGFEFTAYRNDNKNQIIPIPVTPTSGYTNAVINAGLIQTSGLELHINAVPVRSASGFTWEFDINLDRNRSKVVKLQDGLTNYQIPEGSQWRTLTLNAREGEDWGLLVGQGIKKDANGNRMVYGSGPNAGLYIKEENVPLGSVLPKFKGGFLNTFTYKGLSLRVNADFIAGGKFFSTTKMFNNYSGLGAETAGLNELGKPKRDPVSAGGGILLEGVTEDGQPNKTRVETQNLYENWLFALNEYWIYDKTYIKLREIAVGYNLPKNMLGKFIKSANVSLIARNPLLIYSAVGGGIDISESETLWYEGGQLPPVRSFGVNLRLGL